MRIKNPHDIVKFLFYWIKKKRKNSYRYTHVHTYIHTFPYFSRSCTVTQFIYGTPITRWKGYPMERHATHTHVYIYTYIAGNDSMANSFSPATMEIESARDSAFWLMESVALRKKRIKVRAEIINFFLGFVAERSFNQDHPEPRPSSEDDGWLIKRRRRLPRISTPIHRPWRRVNRPALASPEGTAFKAATDHPLSPPPLPPPERRKKTGHEDARHEAEKIPRISFFHGSAFPWKTRTMEFQRRAMRDSNFSTKSFRSYRIFWQIFPSRDSTFAASFSYFDFVDISNCDLFQFNTWNLSNWRIF